MKRIVQTPLFQKVALHFYSVLIADGGFILKILYRKSYTYYNRFFKGEMGSAVSGGYLNNFQNYV